MKIYASDRIYVRLTRERLSLRSIVTGYEHFEKPIMAIEGGILVDGSNPKILATGNDAENFSGMDRVVIVNPFMHPRTLLSDFAVAQKVIANAIKRVKKVALIAKQPNIIFQPLEMLDGGLTQIEKRAFRELFISSGAKTFIGWVGPELSDDEIKNRSFSSEGTVF